MAKKRLRPSQSTTLHNFFSSGPVPAKKGNVKSPASSAKGKQRAVSRASEVIVIDSDDDSAIPAKKAKRRTRDSSSDIEIVEDVHSVVNNRLRDKNIGAISAPGKETPGGVSVKPIAGTSATRRILPRKSSSHSFDGDQISFGQPSSLLRSSPLPKETAPLSSVSSNLLCPDIATGSSFGQPKSLLRSTNEANASSASGNIDETTHPPVPGWGPSDSTSSLGGQISSSFMAQQSTSSNAEAAAAADEEWGTGDDEMVFDGPSPVEEENIEEVDFSYLDDSPSTAGDSSENETIATCPVCGERFVGSFATEIQDHVNTCIDSLSASTSSATPLRPLCSLPAPHNLITSSNTTDASAFSVLMSSHKENEAWKEASVVEDKNFKPSKNNGGRRKAPFYKVLQGMPIAVDAFRYGTIPGVSAYFLTHAHSDHYTNLAANWKGGPIYCSQGTANLIIHMLSVDRKWVHPLPMDVPTTIPNTGGVRVTLIEANHCPGSCLFLFEGPQTINAGDSAFKSPFVGSSKVFRYLHCGDFRASPQHVLHPAVKGKRIDHVYLDTTYLDPKYSFPPQPLVISACAELAKRLVTGGGTEASKTQGKSGWFTILEKAGEKREGKEKDKDRVLIVVGTYSIGKERIVKAIANALQTKVYCDARKAAILRCQSDPELHALLTSDPLTAGVHLVPLGMITSDKLKGYVDRFKGRFSRVVGFRPTGWTFTQAAGSDQFPAIPSIIARGQQRGFTHGHLQPARNSTSALQLYGVPYSEHSSFFELTCFALSFEWGRMIATVNVGNENSRRKMGRWVEKWEVERKKRGAQQGPIDFRELDYW